MTDLNLHLHDALHWRYATKQFDPLRSLTATDWSSLQQALLLSPSSYGLQPWKFVVVTDPALKQQLPAACWGQTQPRDCSHFVVFAARRTVDPQFVQQYLQRIAEIRAVPVTALEGLGTAINGKASRMGSEQLAIRGSAISRSGFCCRRPLCCELMPAPWKAFRRIDWIRC